jgi:hypothetical protein
LSFASIIREAKLLDEEEGEDDDDEDDDEANVDGHGEPGQWGGSRPGRAPNKDRNFARADKLLREYYFSGEASLYDEIDFERRFRMPRSVFRRVHDNVIGRGLFILHTQGNKAGITPLCRLTAKRLCAKTLKGLLVSL